MSVQRSLIRRKACWLAAPIIALVISGASAFAQCDSCQGRCRYGVDGSCRPKRLTYGHYQSTWRQWPEPPPPVPVFAKTERSSDSSVPDVELPEPFDESDPRPEFPHLKKKASDHDPFDGHHSEAPAVPPGEILDMAPGELPIIPDPGADLDLPDPSLEGPFEGGFDGNSSHHLPQGSRPRAVQAEYQRERVGDQWSGNRSPNPHPFNPLRSARGKNYVPAHRPYSNASHMTRTMQVTASMPAENAQFYPSRRGSIRTSRPAPASGNPLR